MLNMPERLNSNAAQQVFALFQQLVMSLNSQIHTDTLEWEQYTVTCCSAANVIEYAVNCQFLAADELDQDTWQFIKAAAAQAAMQDEDDALITVLAGFLPIKKPSHNAQFWSELRFFAAIWLGNLIPESFQRLMFTVIGLSEKVTDDFVTWRRYADVCLMALQHGVEGYIVGVQALQIPESLPLLSDKNAWIIVKQVAAKAGSETTETTKITRVFSTFACILNPLYNHGIWATLLALALREFTEGDEIKFTGHDTRARRALVNPDQLPEGYNLAFLVKKSGFPASYSTLFGAMLAHLQYVMRLYQSDNSGAVYFLVTHSQDYGGYVGLAKVDATNVGRAASDNQILVGEPNYAGKIVWWDTLNAAHPGGCNHPGNGGQIDGTVILSGQDWTRSVGPVHALEPVGKGSGVLFYNFGSLGSDSLPSNMNGSGASSAYMGRLTTQQLNIEAGDDGELDSVLVEQGPDGRYFLICGNSKQTVLWASRELVPDIGKWQQLPICLDAQLDDGSAMLAWAKFGDRPRRLYYVKAENHGMSFYEFKYLECDGEAIAAAVSRNLPPAFRTNQDKSFGDKNWADITGSLYAGFGDGVALYGAFANIDYTVGNELVESVQIRTWFTNPR